VGVAALVLGCAVAALAELELALVVAAYVLLTTAYSRWLKHVAVFDIAVVASGFFLRAVAGGVAADLFISKWFLILSGGGSLFVVTAKRYAELRGAGPESLAQRRVLGEYSEDYLRAMLSTIAGVIVVAYCIWSFEGRPGDPPSALTSASAVPFVLGIMRYGLLVDQGPRRGARGPAAQRPDPAGAGRLLFRPDRARSDPMSTTALLHGWGRTAPTRRKSRGPESVEAVIAALDNGHRRIPRGLGRAYGDAAQNAGGWSSTRRR
jgi:hypothetical protein